MKIFKNTSFLTKFFSILILKSCLFSEKKERSLCSQRATDRGKSQKIISYSFYGSLNSAYFNGILENLAGVSLLYPEYIMRLYYDREKAMEDPEKFETLCDMFCYESNFDLCDVNSLGDSFQIYCSFLLKISARFSYLSLRCLDRSQGPDRFFSISLSFIKNSFLSPPHRIKTKNK